MSYRFYEEFMNLYQNTICDSQTDVIKIKIDEKNEIKIKLDHETINFEEIKKMLGERVQQEIKIDDKRK
jgi:hypothetical protein